MVYDYSGFCEFTFHLKYPAPGVPTLARRVRELLTGAGLPHRPGCGSRLRPRNLCSLLCDVPGSRHAHRATFYAGGLRSGRASRNWPGHCTTPLRGGYSSSVAIELSQSAAVQRGGRSSIQGVRLVAHGNSMRHALLNSRREACRVERRTLRTALPSSGRSLDPLDGRREAAEDELGTRTYHEENVFGGLTASAYRFGVVSLVALRMTEGWRCS